MQQTIIIGICKYHDEQKLFAFAGENNKRVRFNLLSE